MKPSYRKSVTSQQGLDGEVQPPDSVRPLGELLNKY